jgi:hypothetical protein
MVGVISFCVELFCVMRTVGQVAPSDFEETVRVSSELKGEG